MTETVTATYNVANHELKFVNNSEGSFVVIDDRYIINDYNLDYFNKYYCQLKFALLRRMYREVADQRNRSGNAFKMLIKNIVKNIGDFVDLAELTAKDWANQFIKTVSYVDKNVDGELRRGKFVNKQDGKKVLDILTSMFDASKRLDQACVKYYGISDTTMRDNIRMNDERLRQMFNIPKEQSLVNKVFVD